MCLSKDRVDEIVGFGVGYSDEKGSGHVTRCGNMDRIQECSVVIWKPLC